MTPEHPASPDSIPRKPWKPSRTTRFGLLGLLAILLLASAAVVVTRLWLHSAARGNLPQLSGTLVTPGLAASVTITRDPRGVPSIHAHTFDDLLFAQGFTTAGDRLFQMDTLRRHAAGELAEVLGASLVPHDRLQRTLALGPAADRILTELPPHQLHDLERYTAGVNASIAAQHGHLPLEFHVLAYDPQPWTTRDSVLVSLVLFEDLTNTFPQKLNREAFTARLAPSATPEQRADILADLYPVGSWRDHPPSQPATDLTTPLETFPEIPLDDSQVKLHLPPRIAPSPRAVISTEAKQSGEIPSVKRPHPQPPATSPTTTARVPHPSQPHRKPGPPPASLVGCDGWDATPQTATPTDLLALATLTAPACPDCRAGSNNFAVSGAHTATGKPLLSNDMHLTLTAPGIWYAANLQSDIGPQTDPDQAIPFHTAGVSLPGVPYLVVGHNDHVAWGFTNLGADVQDLYLEHLRGSGPATEFQTPDGAWHPVTHRQEVIKVRGGRNLTLDLLATTHGATATPLINPILPSETRPIALRWSLYDTARFSLPFAAINAATSATDLILAASTYTGPAQNLLVADDAGHIAFHAIGRIPLRGPILLPSPLSPVPTDATGPDAAAHEWSSTIPYDQLPATLDPPSGLLATANARTSPDAYPFPITLNWADPYRNERIWRLLANRTGLTPGDMLRMETDVFSDSDHLIAQRLAYAIDRFPKATKRLRAAADLLRAWDGNVTATSPAITTAAREALWPLLLAPYLATPKTPATSTEAHSAQAAVTSTRAHFPKIVISTEAQRSGEIPSFTKSRPPVPPRSLATFLAATATTDPTHLYSWGERNFALEQIIAHTPARWLPSAFATWDDLLTAAVDQGLLDAHAPSILSKWSSGKANPVEIQLPLFAQLPILSRLAGLPTGSGLHPQSGNGLTVRQSGRTFGPSERFTADLANPDASTLVLPLGQSGNPLSPWFRDQFPAWLGTSAFPLPFTSNTGRQTLTLTPN
jgi:penicillin amidase